MTNEEAIKWLESLKRELGQSQFHQLWYFEEPIVKIIELLKEQSNGTN